MAEAMRYDDELPKKIERIYSTPDVVEQRDKALSLLNLQSNEQVLDNGTGPGMTTKMMGELVGHGGLVMGIDISESMLALASHRCADQPWVSFEVGDADELPFGDSSFDAALSTQVYEYVADIYAALEELYRVLRPGGRAVILDSDWDSCVWNTTDRERMHRVIDLWNTHCPHPFLPRTLKQDVERAGLNVVDRDVHTIFNPEYDPNTYSYGMIDIIHSYLTGIGALSQDEIDAWADELHQLGEQGVYFFSLNRYNFVVEKPS